MASPQQHPDFLTTPAISARRAAWRRRRKVAGRIRMATFIVAIVGLVFALANLPGAGIASEQVAARSEQPAKAEPAGQPEAKAPADKTVAAPEVEAAEVPRLRETAGSKAAAKTEDAPAARPVAKVAAQPAATAAAVEPAVKARAAAPAAPAAEPLPFTGAAEVLLILGAGSALVLAGMLMQIAGTPLPRRAPSRA